MVYDISWIIPRLRSPGRLWSCASSLTVAVVGLFSKLVIEFLNKTTVYNGEALRAAVSRRPRGTPLLTISNHHSCFDDPGLWGVLDCVALVRGARMRWSLAAHDICFTKALHATFFALGRCVPVVRGAGVHQPAMDFCVERLRRGDWVHIFPEGRVNVEKAALRFKWGVGRLVREACGASAAGDSAAPMILPVWHEGMDGVLPNREPYLLSFRKRVFLHVGEPIQISHLLDSLRKSNASEEETRRAITERVQQELYSLRDKTHALIKAALGAQAHSVLGERTDVGCDAPTTATAATANGHAHTHAHAHSRQRQPERDGEL